MSYIDNTPPQAPEFERAVLSAMLFEVEAIETAVQMLTPEMFYKPANALIFKAMATLFGQGNPVDQLTVSEYLRQQGILEQVGGEAYIAGLSGEITGAANVGYHCRMITEKYQKRQIIAVTTSIQGMAFEDKISALEIIGTLQENVFKLSERSNDKPYRPVSEFMVEAYDKVLLRANSDKVTGIPSGIERLDYLLDGFQQGNMYILAARPGEGKSALAGQIAVNAAENDFPVGIFALEMMGRDVGIRFMSAKARRNLSPRNLRISKPNSEEWGRLSKACADISNLPIFIDQTTGLSISQIFAKANRMKRDFGAKLIIIDYLQLMSGEGNEPSREREIAKISKGLHDMCKAIDVPVLALSQLSRKAVESEYRKPILSDLRESGAIEQDADAVIFIHNPSPEEKQGLLFTNENGMPVEHSDGVRSLVIRKDRHGEVGEIYVYWQKEYVAFYNLEY